MLFCKLYEEVQNTSDRNTERIVETETESERDAVEKVRQMYRNCGIILDASDYIKTEISAER